MSRKLYYCCVAGCSSTSRDTEKLFFTAPLDPDRRKLWLRAIKRDTRHYAQKTSVQVCEDHFDLEHDLENYIRFRYYPETRRKMLRKNVVPHIFNCQSDSVVMKEEITSELILDSIVVKEEITSEAVAVNTCEQFQELERPSVRCSQDYNILSGPSMYGCRQCPYQANWSFELDHHVFKVHSDVYNFELFKLEPEQFNCMCCGFKSHYKLCLYEHCKYQHCVPNDGTENEQQGFKTEFFDDPKSSGLLSLLKRNFCEKLPSEAFQRRRQCYETEPRF